MRISENLLSVHFFTFVTESFSYNIFKTLNYSQLTTNAQLPLDSTAFPLWFDSFYCTLCHKFSMNFDNFVECLMQFLLRRFSHFLLLISHQLHYFIASWVLVCVVVHFKTPENAKTVPILTKFRSSCSMIRKLGWLFVVEALTGEMGEFAVRELLKKYTVKKQHAAAYWSNLKIFHLFQWNLLVFVLLVVIKRSFHL